ncbi:serpin (serine proteinase inhibitor) superfamily protein [Cardiosporidium cionae]|uniref:Serpin (Serine proteinase inhibitor) superfamily protein n=1 Tax=Cardiosporidium cionae TaxID=476202 RepID=A0ABQ7J457_9APIC|nr:serpin (serine proteinase inhibitor) superfamily protein [Cardiosporidium cionae]|eukprot:KAF8817863.1 serpin (serine proteinase inhibitor) superfamily protein [Cardiosporidium cionae]
MLTKLLFIGLAIFLNCKQLLANPLGNNGMLPTTGKFYRQLAELLVDDKFGVEGNLVISPACIAYMDLGYLPAVQNEALDQYHDNYFNMLSNDEIYTALNPYTFGINSIAPDFSRPEMRARSALDLGMKIVFDKSWQNSKGAKDYAAVLKNMLQTEVVFENLARDNEEVLTRMNNWVSEFTRGKITKILPAIHQDAKMVLVTALYFRSQWTKEFSTSPDSSYRFESLQNGHVVTQKAKSMYVFEPADDRFDLFKYDASYGTVMAVRIPFVKEGMSMVIYMPQEATQFGTFLKHWSRHDELLNDILKKSLRTDSSTRYRLTLEMPKFTIEAPAETIDLVPVLQKYGITNMFDTMAASFKMSPVSSSTAVRSYYHKAMVAVDEVGAEAAAACSDIASDSLFRPRVFVQLKLVVNKPFLFQIVGDIRTNEQIEGKMVYFTGQITDAARAQNA